MSGSAGGAAGVGPARYRAHGYELAVESDHRPLPLPPAPAAADDRAPDGILRVTVAGARPVPAAAPPGEPVACLPDDDGDGAFYTFTRTSSALVLRFHGAADVEADPLLRRATVHVDPTVGPDVVPVLLPGTVMAVRLMLDGHLVLHASAVARGGAALGVVGASGGGKSTLAALGVLAGLDLVTDDVLRVDLAAPAPRVWPGATAARLRPAVRRVARRFGADAARTVDGRFVARADRVVTQPQRLAALVLPSLDRRERGVRVERLDPADALQRLVLAPRVVGWREPVALGRQFLQLAELAERVPVVRVRVPVARRHDPAVVEELFERLAGPAADAVAGDI